MYKAFISYSWQDVDVVEALHARLEESPYVKEHGFAFWRDRTAPMKDLRNRWEEDIWRAFHEAQIVLFAVSPHSLLHGSFALVELEMARRYGKFVLPVLLQDVSTLPRTYAGVFKALPLDGKAICPPGVGPEKLQEALDRVVDDFAAHLGTPPALSSFEAARRQDRIERLVHILEKTQWDGLIKAQLGASSTRDAAVLLVDAGLRCALGTLGRAEEERVKKTPPHAGAHLAELLGELAPLVVDAQGRVYAMQACSPGDSQGDSQGEMGRFESAYETLAFVEIGLAALEGRKAELRLHPTLSHDFVGRRYVHVPDFDAGVDPQGKGHAQQVTDALAAKFELKGYANDMAHKRAKGRLTARAGDGKGAYYLAMPQGAAAAALDEVRRLYPALHVVQYQKDGGPDADLEYCCLDLLGTLLRARGLPSASEDD